MRRRGNQHRARSVGGWIALAVIATMSAAGCEEPTTGVVTGTVTVDGQPAKSGAISFFPVDGRSRTTGAEIIDGQYTAEAPFGVSKVEIRVSTAVGQKKLYDTPDSPMKPILVEALPARYNDRTELTVDVQPGENRQDFTLTTE
jgi:hypothetical protein